jgi:hypothetical protein
MGCCCTIVEEVYKDASVGFNQLGVKKDGNIDSKLTVGYENPTAGWGHNLYNIEDNPPASSPEQLRLAEQKRLEEQLRLAEQTRLEEQMREQLRLAEQMRKQPATAEQTQDCISNKAKAIAKRKPDLQRKSTSTTTTPDLCMHKFYNSSLDTSSCASTTPNTNKFQFNNLACYETTEY